MDYKNIGLKKPQNFNFSKGVSPQFWSKIWDFDNFSFYAKYTDKKIGYDNLAIKQAFYTKNMDLRK